LLAAICDIKLRDNAIRTCNFGDTIKLTKSYSLKTHYVLNGIAGARSTMSVMHM